MQLSRKIENGQSEESAMSLFNFLCLNLFIAFVAARRMNTTLDNVEWRSRLSCPDSELVGSNHSG